MHRHTVHILFFQEYRLLQNTGHMALLKYSPSKRIVRFYEMKFDVSGK